MHETVPPLTLLPNLPGGGSRGSVEHFYHFLLSYFLPLENYISLAQPSALVLRDCGPMNPWFELLPPGTELLLRPAKALAAERAEREGNFSQVNSWERKSWSRRRRIHRARHGVLVRQGIRTSPTENRVTLINRAPSLAFYHGPAETKTSGADRRSLPNFAELADALGKEVPLHLFEGEHLPPLDQLRAMSGTTVLIGQHGAGLANMVWMPAGGFVIEILPTTVGRRQQGLFRALARTCGHRYVAVSQANNHSPVDVVRVVSALLRSLGISALKEGINHEAQAGVGTGDNHVTAV